jgi:hypothetical protein
MAPSRNRTEKPPIASIALSEQFTLPVVMEAFRRAGVVRPRKAAK